MNTRNWPASAGLAIALRTLLLDARAAEAIGVLAAHDVPSILLKGRAIANWLYSGTPRGYGDIDLLVDPRQRERAMEVLATLGYRHYLAGADESEYGSNETDLISPTGIPIDLHHTLLGVTADPTSCWEVLSARTTAMVVGGHKVHVLDEPARTMHLALHVAQNGPADAKAVADMERGLAQLPFSHWDQASHIARALKAEQAFSAGLRVTVTGRAMAAALHLEIPRDVSLLLRTRSAPAEALQIQQLIELRTLRGRLHLIGRKLWPTTAYMLGRVPGSRDGPQALLLARLRRMAGLPARFRVAFHSWSEARSAAAHTNVTERAREIPQ
jgi:Uncharacterised nucleotidyltransferase